MAPVPDPAEDILRRLEATRPEDGYVPPAAGAAVHAYASAPDSAARAHVDLSALTGEQVLWLMGLSSADLERLARVGPKGCDRAARGKPSGVVGLSRPRREVSGRVGRETETDARYDYVPGHGAAWGM